MDHIAIFRFAKKHRTEGKIYFLMDRFNAEAGLIEQGNRASFYLGDGEEVEGVISRIEGYDFDHLNVVIEDDDGVYWSVDAKEIIP